MTKITLLDIKKEQSRRNFWEYCKLKDPTFYKESRPHLKKLCDTLNDFHYNRLLNPRGEPYSKLMLRIPPQFGKTRTLVNFNQWSLGRNHEERIITGSYGDDPAGDMARYTRDGIQEVKNLPNQIVFSDIFPDCKIKQGNASYYKWALEGQHFSYLGVGVGGAVTGKGATLRIIDDLVKDAQVAMNKAALHKIWIWLSGTFSSRNSAEGGSVKEIFCATLWNKDDPQGILERDEPEEWYILEMQIYDEETDTMLCDDFMNKENYLKLKSRMLKDPITSVIFWANYHSKKKKLEGKLYGEFMTYKELPVNSSRVYNYTDVADEGNDNLCSITYIKINDLAYILDVYYSKEGTNKTEDELCKRLKEFGVNYCYVESNAGGKIYMKDLKKISKELKNHKTIFRPKHQSKNKIAKIKTNSSNVMKCIVFPSDWNVRWFRFYDDVSDFNANGKNENDDAPDVLSEIAMEITKKAVTL
jgi:predicted phage terminase large subunit-like protein